MKATAAVIMALVVCAILAFFPGCSRFNGTKLEPVLGADINLVSLGDTIAEQLIGKSVPPLLPWQAQQPILVVTPVNNDALDTTTSFGRSFQNNLAAGFVNRGFSVREIKLRGALLVEQHQGEFMLTRDLQELAAQQQAQAVIVTTYSLANRVMYLSVRLVDPTDHTIRSAYEDKLYLDPNTLKMLGLHIKKTEPTPDAAEEQVRPPSPSIIDRILD